MTVLRIMAVRADSVYTGNCKAKVSVSGRASPKHLWGTHKDCAHSAFDALIRCTKMSSNNGTYVLVLGKEYNVNILV